ncbi:hypothetical protein OPQ81_008898 [Rhizoctonia solani]|nr:hypothetical protein OPQ81_008898 [Rhizoctonia solani]
MMPSASFIVFAFLGLFSTITRAYPMGLNARQASSGTSAPPACALTCTALPDVEPLIPSCIQLFTLCLTKMCMDSEYQSASRFVAPYCSGEGITYVENGVAITDIPPVPSGATTTSTTTNAPLSGTPTVVVVTRFVTVSDASKTVVTTSTPTTSSTITPVATQVGAFATDNPTPTLVSPPVITSASTTIIESMNSSAALRSPAAIAIYVIISFIVILLIILFICRWRYNRGRDYVIPSHRRTRGKSFLIDECSLKRRSFNNAFESTTKPAPVYNLALKEQTPLPALPIPTKGSSDLSAGIALSYIPHLAITRPSTRNYTALPGRSPMVSPERSSESKKSLVTQTFAAGRERAITNIRHSREGSRSPTSPSSSISSLSSVNGDMYAAATRSPLPAYAYIAPHQPAAPSPLRVQLEAKPTTSRVSTIPEEPRTPHGVESLFSTATTTPVPNSKAKTAQRVRATFATHVRNPGSAERIQQFTFPNTRQSLNATELQITISEALMDDVPVSRSQTPNGSLHRGAGGSVSSISKVHGKLQALVVGIRRDRD